MLNAYLRSVLVDANVVDDLFQETLLVAWRRLDDFDSSRPFGPWLRGIAKHLVLEWRRKSARSPRMCNEEVLARIDKQIEGLRRMPGDTFGEKLSALQDCLEGLPSSYREAVDLRYQDRLKPAEIAGQLDINVETIKKRLQRARAMLLDCINGKLVQAGRT